MEEVRLQALTMIGVVITTIGEVRDLTSISNNSSSSISRVIVTTKDAVQGQEDPWMIVSNECQTKEMSAEEVRRNIHLILFAVEF